jgi:hypothetical protein
MRLDASLMAVRKFISVRQQDRSILIMPQFGKFLKGVAYGIADFSVCPF